MSGTITLGEAEVPVGSDRGHDIRDRLRPEQRLLDRPRRGLPAHGGVHRSRAEANNPIPDTRMMTLVGVPAVTHLLF